MNETNITLLPLIVLVLLLTKKQPAPSSELKRVTYPNMRGLTIYTTAPFSMRMIQQSTNLFKYYRFVTRTRSISVPSVRKHAISSASRVTSIVR